jgi:hypothetical protein
MKWLALLLLLSGCGITFTPGAPLNATQHEAVVKIEAKLDVYFGIDLSSVFNNIDITMKSEPDVSRDCGHAHGIIGCYIDHHISISTNANFCQTVTHELLHAIYDKLDGDPDAGHKHAEFIELPEYFCPL